VTTFFLIRHAERTGDQDLLAGRTPGFHLTATGREQATKLARHLAAEPIRHVFSSPMERARETAEPLARQLGLVVEVLPAIHEIDSGQWTGQLFRELDAGDATWRRFNRVRSLTRIPGGESMVEVQARFINALLELHQTFPDDDIALVSHADPIKIALAAFLGAPLDFYDRLEIGLASVSEVALDHGGARVRRINDTAR
jgi:broad specificity phosphatase PhoE